ncbi:MAG: imidazole glycerol phosphate synthase subunit HisH [Brooklawnia sp.]|nr:imidazole glycerol phosphate synthase subunit HisH [Brooklawnia sp.]
MNQPVVGVLDYGSGNLHSACRALEAAGARVLLGQRWADFGGAAALVLPGVGAFAACMSQLRAIAGDDLVREWVAAERKLLGICVGHQVLFTRGVEHGVDSAGIGIFPGTVERLAAQRLPHMGWNTIEPPCDQGVFTGLSGRRFYFVHSYGVHARDAAGRAAVPSDALVAWAEHEGDRFVAAVQSGSVTSTQFHPEKSGAAGARLLRSWLTS